MVNKEEMYIWTVQRYFHPHEKAGLLFINIQSHPIYKVITRINKCFHPFAFQNRPGVHWAAFSPLFLLPSPLFMLNVKIRLKNEDIVKCHTVMKSNRNNCTGTRCTPCLTDTTALHELSEISQPLFDDVAMKVWIRQSRLVIPCLFKKGTFVMRNLMYCVACMKENMDVSTIPLTLSLSLVSRIHLDSYYFCKVQSEVPVIIIFIRLSSDFSALLIWL